MRWSEIQWVNTFGRQTARLAIGAYTLSLIQEVEPDLFEIAILKDSEFIQMPGINDQGDDDVLRFLTKPEVIAIIRKIEGVSGASPKNKSRDT